MLKAHRTRLLEGSAVCTELRAWEEGISAGILQKHLQAASISLTLKMGKIRTKRKKKKKRIKRPSLGFMADTVSLAA